MIVVVIIILIIIIFLIYHFVIYFGLIDKIEGFQSNPLLDLMKNFNPEKPINEQLIKLGNDYGIDVNNVLKNLDLSTVSEQSGKYLHQFEWLKTNEIGSIPRHWNWLVNWYKETDEDKPSALHFTEGGPWIVDSEYKDLWLKYKKQMEINNVRK